MFFTTLCLLSALVLSEQAKWPISLSHGNGGMVLMPKWTTSTGEKYFSFCLPDVVKTGKKKRKIGKFLCKLAGYKRYGKFIGTRDEYQEWRRNKGLDEIKSYFTDKSCLPKFGVIGLRCRRKNLEKLEDCNPKYSWTHPTGCIIGKDEIFLHCRKKIQENPKGEPLWSEWKATESFCNAENEYQQLTRQCIRGTCSGPWFMVKACDSCGKPIDGIKDYNEDYYSASSYSSSYNDNDEQVDNHYGEYNITDLMSSDNYDYGNYDYRKRSKREIKECQCQIYSDTDTTNKGKSKSKKTTKRKLPKKKLKCLVDYSNWKSEDGSSCQEIYQERRKDARKIEGYDLCPQSNKCAFEKKYTRGNCSAFLINYEERGSFAKAREFNGRLDESSWWKGNYTKLPDVVKFGDHSVYKLDKKITYAIYVKQCWVITGHLTDHIPFFKNENANPNCPALSDTNSWEFWDDPAENDPRLRFELPQWKYIHERVPNPKFTTKTLQHSDFSNCNKTVQDAIIFILFSKRFLEDESKTEIKYKPKFTRMKNRDMKKFKETLSKLESCQDDSVENGELKKLCAYLNNLRNDVCGENGEELSKRMKKYFHDSHGSQMLERIKKSFDSMMETKKDS